MSRKKSTKPDKIQKKKRVASTSKIALLSSRWLLALFLVGIAASLILVGVLIINKPPWNRPSELSTSHKRSSQDYHNHILKLLLGGNFDEALPESLEAVLNFPKDPLLAITLADVYAFQNNYNEALPAYHRALELSKNDKHNIDIKTKALTWIGVCHRRLGEKDKAYLWLHRAATEGAPKRETFHHLLKSNQIDQHYPEAVKWLAKCIAMEPKDEDFSTLSNLLSIMGHWDLLAQALESCLGGMCELSGRGYPVYRIHLDYSIALEKSGYPSGETIEHFEKAIELSGKTEEVLLNEKQRYIQAANNNSVLNLDKESLFELRKELSELYMPIFAQKTPAAPAWRLVDSRHVKRFDWPITDDLLLRTRTTLEIQKQAFKKDANNPDAFRDLVNSFICLTLPVFTLEDCVFAARVSSVQTRLSMSKDPVKLLDYDTFQRVDYPDLSESQPLRIGLFSADVRGHPMLALLSAFVRHTHLMPTVKVTLYHTEADENVLSILSRYCDDSVQCYKNKYIDCVQHARMNKIQIWLETTGSTGKGISRIAAAGPAPVGILWAGFPGSMASPSTLQYMVSDHYTVPPNSEIAEAYPEKQLYVPGSWMIADASVIDDLTSTTFNLTREELRERYHIPINATTVYSYFGRTWKVDDITFNAWKEIIQRVPDSYLVMTHYVSDVKINPGEVKENFRKSWKRSGLSEERLVIIPPFRRGEHIHVMRALCDVALDTSIYGGGTTAYEALYSGLPMVHYSAGWKMMQRAGGSILMAAGLKELIVDSFESYVDKAVQLGTDSAYYGDLKRRLDDAILGHNDSNVLFRPELGIQAMVNGMRKAYQIWEKGDPPRAIQIDHRNDALPLDDRTNDEL